MPAIDLRKLLHVPAELDKRSTQALLDAIKDSYIAEFDYLKFMHSVQTLQNMEMDEETAFKSAFATARTMGFTKEAFVKTHRYYLKVLSNQRERFAEALKRQREEKISGKSDKFAEIRKRIADNEKKIKKLQEENKAYALKLEQSDSTIEKEKAKLKKVTKNFVKSYEFIETQLKTDLELFEKYI